MVSKLEFGLIWNQNKAIVIAHFASNFGSYLLQSYLPLYLFQQLHFDIAAASSIAVIPDFVKPFITIISGFNFLIFRHDLYFQGSYLTIWWKNLKLAERLFENWWQLWVFYSPVLQWRLRVTWAVNRFYWLFCLPFQSVLMVLQLLDSKGRLRWPRYLLPLVEMI